MTVSIGGIAHYSLHPCSLSLIMSSESPIDSVHAVDGDHVHNHSSRYHYVQYIVFILQHAWFNLCDKHMTTGRINHADNYHHSRDRHPPKGQPCCWMSRRWTLQDGTLVYMEVSFAAYHRGMPQQRITSILTTSLLLLPGQAV